MWIIERDLKTSSHAQIWPQGACKRILTWNGYRVGRVVDMQLAIQLCSTNSAADWALLCATLLITFKRWTSAPRQRKYRDKEENQHGHCGYEKVTVAILYLYKVLKWTAINALYVFAVFCRIAASSKRTSFSVWEPRLSVLSVKSEAVSISKTGTSQLYYSIMDETK